MKKTNIVFLEVEPEDIFDVKKNFPEAHIETKVLNEEEIIKKYPDAEILCVFIYSKISKKVIDNLSKLKCIVTRSVGYDHIDLKTAQKKGIRVCNVPDYGSHVIAEHVFALLLSSIRCIREGDERVEKCYFDFHGLRGKSLKGKTLGIIGTGKIGRNVARIASLGFLMDVIMYDVHLDPEITREYHCKYVKLEEIWKKSDIISLHIPLLESTKHIVNNKTIQKMKNGVVLINTARGELIETKALVKALKSGKISHVALDVLEHEHNIKESNELIQIPNVITTPHIAFYADESMKKMYSEAIQSIQAFLKGQECSHQIQGT